MGDGSSPDNPAHRVNLPDYWIFQTKVTNRQFAICVQSGLCTPPSERENPGFNDALQANHPVTGVTQQQALRYCTFAHARLPTEAEWEKAARGPGENIYPWGNTKPGCDLLNSFDCVGHTTPVNTYDQGASYYGAFDLKGNTFEWLSDWYDAGYYTASPTDSPLGPFEGDERSVRGSAFNSGANQSPAALRFYTRPEISRDNLGFRCVVTEPSYYAPYCAYAPAYGTAGLGGPAAGPQAEVSCPEVSITLEQVCQDSKRMTQVKFAGPADALITVPTPTCTDNGGGRYLCSNSVPISICSECSITVPGDPICPERTTYDPATKTCKGVGGLGLCMPGYAYDYTSQCCAVEPGKEERVPLSACPPGTSYDASNRQCLSVPVDNPHCQSTNTYSTGACGGGTLCEPQFCLYGTWDPNACACVYNTAP
jgi:iron(II)-dependent oxidoreductase